MSGFTDSLMKMEQSRLSSLPGIGAAAYLTDYTPDESGMWTGALNQALSISY